MRPIMARQTLVMRRLVFNSCSFFNVYNRCISSSFFQDTDFAILYKLGIVNGKPSCNVDVTHLICTKADSYVFAEKYANVKHIKNVKSRFGKAF